MADARSSERLGSRPCSWEWGNEPLPSVNGWRQHNSPIRASDSERAQGHGQIIVDSEASVSGRDMPYIHAVHLPLELRPNTRADAGGI